MGYYVETNSYLKSFQETSMSAPLRSEEPRSQRRRSHQGRHGSCHKVAEQMIENEEQEEDFSDQSQSKGRMDAWTRKVHEEAESDKEAYSPVTQLTTMTGVGSENSFSQSELHLMDTH